MFIASRRFLHIEAISPQKEARSRDYALLLFRMPSRVIYSAQYHRQHCTLHTFEQIGSLYMHNHDNKYPARPGFEPGTSRLQAPVDTNEPVYPANTTHLRNMYTMLDQRRSLLRMSRYCHFTLNDNKLEPLCNMTYYIYICIKKPK